MDVSNNPSSLPSTRWPYVIHYEVFLSFRGEDVREAFIESLYESLTASGIYAFIDQKGIEIGEEIMPKILQVIRHTEICIPVFSKDFASSKSCLMEVAEMVECNRTIMPIFYNVTPSVVGKQEESYEKSFSNHADKGVKAATIDKWKEALKKVSDTLGWNFDRLQCGEHQLIKNVVSKVSELLGKDDLELTPHLVGMGHHVQEMMKKLGVHYENGKVVEGQMLTGRRVVQISGLSGIGRTTLATVVYNKIRHLFECWSFLEDIKGKFERGRLISLQEDLIRALRKESPALRSSAERAKFIKYRFKNLRALIILDDVSDFA